MPLCRAPVPLGQANLAAKMQHQRFQCGGRIEWKPHRVQFLFGRQQIRAKASEIFHQHQRMFLLFKKPDRHERGKIAVVLIVAQEHFGGRQRGPFGDRVHFDGHRLFVGEFGRVKIRPWNITRHVPARFFQIVKKFGVNHFDDRRGGGHRFHGASAFMGDFSCVTFSTPQSVRAELFGRSILRGLTCMMLSPVTVAVRRAIRRRLRQPSLQQFPRRSVCHLAASIRPSDRTNVRTGYTR